MFGGGFGTAPGGRPLGSYQFGASGVTGGGYINWLDGSNSLVDLYRQKVAASEQAWRDGKITNPNEMQSLRDSLKRWEDIQSNRGVTPQIFALPEYSTDNFFTEANEASRLPGMGGQVRADAVEATLPESLRGQNRGQLMRPWTATGLVDSNFGSGSEGNYVAGGIARNMSTTAPTDPNRVSAFGGAYNGGDLRSASQFGSYQSPLLRGGDAHGAVARVTPNWGGSTTNPFQNQSGNLSNPSPLWDQPRDSGPRFDDNGRSSRPGGGYIQNTPNGPYEVDRFGNRLSSGMQSSTFGAMAMPYGGPSTVDYRKQPDFSPRYMGPYSQAYYNNAMNSAAIYGGLLGSGNGYSASPSAYYQPGQGIFNNDFNRRGGF